MSEVTVVTCSHNPRPAYLEATIRGLKGQTLGVGRWEFILIDNASSPERAPKAQLDWHPGARLIHEPELGLTPARLRGIREAGSDLLVFVDDDNVLDPDYLQNALQVAESKPYLGAWSGQCRPGFEKPAEEWTRRYWGNLALREFDRSVWSNLPHLPESMPCGAGLCVRREVARQYLSLHESGARKITLDRAGKSFASAGDNDLAACACDVGLGVGLFAELRLTHLIPPERLTLEYLAGLCEGIAYSGIIFRSFRESGTLSDRRSGPIARLADLVRMMRMDRRQRRIYRAWRSGEQRAWRQLGR